MIKVKVCVGTNCSFNGGLELLEYLEENRLLKDKIEIETSRCFNKVCKPDNSPVVMIDEEMLTRAKLDDVLMKISEKLK
jgi:NADH:ubiquinone oxidoreductase subunit E